MAPVPDDPWGLPPQAPASLGQQHGSTWDGSGTQGGWGSDPADRPASGHIAGVSAVDLADEQATRPPVALLAAAGVLGAFGAVATLLPAAPALLLVISWLLGGVAAWVLVVLYTHVDVRRQAGGWYLGSAAVGWLRAGCLGLAVVTVVLSSVRFALLASHGVAWFG